MARKNQKKDSQPKRIQVTDQSGWTHIIKGSRSQRNQLHIQPVDILKPQNPDPAMTLEKASQSLARYTREWQQSKSYTQTQTILEEGVLTAENVRITNCVCLGLGSLTGTDAFKASWYQLATLNSILETLREKHPLQKIYFQDPLFNSLDTAFLSALGHTVLPSSSPAAHDPKIMTQDTFLFAPHLEYKHIALVFETAFPALYVGSALEVWVDTGINDETASPDAKRIFKRFLAGRENKCMPSFEPDEWWRYIGICWLGDG